MPGQNLFLLGTGTGLAPFASIIRDPDVYDRFERIILVHGCREIAELGYGEDLVAALPDNELLGDLVRDKLLYYPTVTREPFRNHGRITTLLETGKLTSDLGMPRMNPGTDRMMLCGSPAFLTDMVTLLDRTGFTEGSGNAPGTYVIEKAFVDK